MVKADNVGCKKPSDIIELNKEITYWSKEDEMMFSSLFDLPCCIAQAVANNTERGLSSTKDYLFCWTGVRIIMFEIEDFTAGIRIIVLEPKGLEFKQIKVYDEERWLKLAKLMMLDVL